VEEVTVNIMPTETAVLEMTSAWFQEAVATAPRVDLRGGVKAPVIMRPYFLAIKLTAYRNRGAKDPCTSRSLEDIVTLFDECQETDSLLGEESSALNI
jgi:hypothetical protein